MKSAIIISIVLVFFSCNQFDNTNNQSLLSENILLRDSIILLNNKVEMLQDSITQWQIGTGNYMYGVPPAPPYQEANLVITQNVLEGCYKIEESIFGYIIEFSITDDVIILLIQDQEGVRINVRISKNEMSNASMRWLPLITIPGNFIKINAMACGSGLFLYAMNIENLKRE